jgi:hypothetical protein
MQWAVGLPSLSHTHSNAPAEHSVPPLPIQYEMDEAVMQAMTTFAMLSARPSESNCLGRVCQIARLKYTRARLRSFNSRMFSD